MGIPRVPLPSVEFLKAILDYNPKTGALIWKLGRRHAGKAAGTVYANHGGRNFYLLVGIRENGKYHQFKAHRVVFKMKTGTEPPDNIDHRDGDGLNMKWKNIRSATSGQNIQNSQLRVDNKTGFKGVLYVVRGGCKRYRAKIRVNGRQFHIGYFRTAAAAGAARNQAAERLHGQFARAK